MNPPSVLLFDVGGVVIENGTFQDLPRLLTDPPEGQALYNKWLDSKAVQKFERGEIDEHAFAAHFVAEWEIKLEPAAFLDVFRGWPKGPFPGVLDLLTSLRPHYTIAYLTNCNSVHWQRLQEIMPYADHAFSSHHYGIVKPDPAIFERVIKELDRPAQDICFFDDSLKNVVAAQVAGMQAHHTVGFAALQSTVHALGLYPAD